jgi:hypothetical protein
MEKHKGKIMRAEKLSYSGPVSHFVISFILLASLLVLLNLGCDRNEIGDTFEKGQLKYAVRSEDKASSTGTVSVEAISKDISGNIEIPASVTFGGINYSVTEIGHEAFSYCYSLTNIIIPDSVTSIGENAFDGCDKLPPILFSKEKKILARYSASNKETSYTVPDSVISIGDMAFSICRSLTNIIIPDSVTSIGEMAFRGCSSLTEIIVGENNSNYSSLDGVLFNKDRTTLIQCPGGKSGVYTIPDSVTEIGYYAFYGCSSLTNVTIPDSVTEIGDGAFDGCDKLPPVLFNEGNEILVRYSSSNKETSYIIPDTVTYIFGGAFQGCRKLKNVVIPDSITVIGDRGFYDCIRMTNIVIPDSVTSISRSAFRYCSSLTSIIIPDSVTEISGRAFQGCNSLTSVVIPDSVTSIGRYAFSDCGKLTAVYFKGDAPKLPEGNAFSNPSVIYYKPDTTGWPNPWGGRHAKEWVE